MGLKIFIDGVYLDKPDAKISVFDHGLLYGDGVFEGIRSYDRKVFRLSRHLDRLYHGAEIMRLTIPYDESEMRGKILDTLRVNGIDNGYIRLVVTRGAGDLGLDPFKCPKPIVIIITDEITLYPREFYEKGLPIITAKTRRVPPASISPRIKSLNYLNNILGKLEAIDAGVNEALMLTVDDHIAECTGDNIFIVKDGKIKTPPYEVGALKGITSEAVVELARKEGMDVSVEMLKVEDIISADECFLTGTAAEIIPVIKLDGTIIGKGVPGDITKKLTGAFRGLTKVEGVPY